MKTINILKEQGLPFSFFSSFKAFKMLPVVFVLGFGGFAGWDLVEPVPTPNNLNSVHFINPAKGWMVGYGAETDTGEIFNSVDSGKTWIRQFAQSKGVFVNLFFLDSNNGWATGMYNYATQIYNTKNEGTSWILQHSIPFPDKVVNINDIQFTDSNNGWYIGYIYGDSSWISHTSDGGNTWNIQYSSSLYDFNSIFFINSTTGWVCGDTPAGQGRIFKTNNGGVNWTKQYENNSTNDGLNDIYFVDANNGWAAGDDGLTVHTEDGGESWERQASGPENTYAIHFTDKSTGWQVGNWGKVVHTSDGGETWEVIVLDNSKGFYDVYFTDHYHGWIVGGDGAIYRTTDGGGYPYPIINKYNIVPKNFAINNYPNPFNSSTNIEFQISIKSDVSIDIYNTKGEKIKQLYNGNLSPNKYNFTWNGMNESGRLLSCGVYYVVLTSEADGNVSKVKKNITLLK